MKTEFTDVSDTQKTVTIEIPTDVVDAEIDRVARGYTKQARIPGFRPGKVPQTIVKQRFREQILHDVMHGLIPRAVEEALQQRGIEPVETPHMNNEVIHSFFVVLWSCSGKSRMSAASFRRTRRT